MFLGTGMSDERDNYARESRWPGQIDAYFLRRLTEATSSSEQLKIRTSNSPRRFHWNKTSRFARATRSDDRRRVVQRRRKITARHPRRAAAQHFLQSEERPGTKDCPRRGIYDRTAVAQSCRR